MEELDDIKEVSEKAETENEDEGRPPVDPKNKMYTVISLLIFAVGYFLIGYVKDNITLAYALYNDNPSDEAVQMIASELKAENISAECELEYIRLHHNFDNNTLYAAFSVIDDSEEIEQAAEKYIPYDYGDSHRDIRLTVYPYNDMVPQYVYGDKFVSIDDPSDSCFIYETAEGYTALFMSDDYSSDVYNAFEGIEKIKIK